MPFIAQVRGQAAAAAIILLCCMRLDAGDTVRIMPLGDSRVAGPSSRDCFRLYLDRYMTAAGYAFDFVGTRTCHDWTCKAPDSLFDADHQGMWGWTLAQMLSASPGLGSWLRAERPDMVLAMLGTTDILSDDSLSVKLPAVIERIRAAIDTIRAVNPSAVIFLSNLYPAYPPYFSNWHHLDSLRIHFPAIAAACSSEQSPVLLIDTWSGFSPYLHLVDGLHSNRPGSMQVARRFLDKMLPWFDTIPPPLQLRRSPMILQVQQAASRVILLPFVSREALLFSAIGRMLPATDGRLAPLRPVIDAWPGNRAWGNR